MTEPYDAIVIGGGPAGMMAAIEMAERGLRVLIAERNKLLGRKLRITGKGRCNITNNCDFDTLIQNICQGGKFMYSSLRRFSNQDVIDFFETHGLETVTERGGRVFPASQKAYDVAELFANVIRALKIPVLYECRVQKLLLNEDTPGCIMGVSAIVCGKMRKIPCKNVVLATGGITYPLTGSTGDGYALAKQVGHTIVPPKPSLVALKCREKATCAALEGLSLKNVSLRLEKGEKRLYEDFGEMVFTDTGVSGPLVLSASRHVTDDSVYKIHIDLKPGLSRQQLDTRILSDFSKYEKKDFVNALDDLLPKRMIEAIVSRSGIPARQKVSCITREQRMKLVDILKDFTLTPYEPASIDQAIVTAGGISLSEVEPKSMRSKLCPNLYFAGEVLDVDAYTGGYNLTIAFSTGFTAGNFVEG
ncbi:MAG: NAD(P)/FAD-dependent oxidoreductase [Clostridia bacterium]|nr:NAD(P)/FAD-dependent oxidoreductase [Clostridia bacterium]